MKSCYRSEKACNLGIINRKIDRRFYFIYLLSIIGKYKKMENSKMNESFWLKEY